MILRATSQTPIGRIPGFLSRATRQQAKRGARIEGWINSVHRQRARRAREWHKSLDASLNEQHIRRHAWALSPDGPSEPFVCLAAWQHCITIKSVNILLLDECKSTMSPLCRTEWTRIGKIGWGDFRMRILKHRLSGKDNNEGLL